MIQLLISTEVNVKEVMNTEGFNFQCATVSEMVNGWLILINEKDDFDAIEEAIEELGDVDIVGTYNMDGTHFQWVNPNSNRNHSLTKYTNKLKPKIVDEEEIPYTEEEALEKQVNLVYGYPNRILADD